MKSIELGFICTDCFNALNFDTREVQPDDIPAMVTSAKKLAELADVERVTSLHSGDSIGVSKCQCDACGSRLAGERWLLNALKDDRQ